MASHTPTRASTESALAVCKQFVKCFRAENPLAEASLVMIPTGYGVVQHVKGVVPMPLRALVQYIWSMIASLYSSGAASVDVVLTDDNPETWAGGNIAAVVSGYVVRVDDQDRYHGICIFSLLGDDTDWKISALTAIGRSANETLPPLKTEPAPEAMVPINSFFDNLTKYDWEALSSGLLEDSGATLSRRPKPPLCVSWPDFVRRLKEVVASLPPGKGIEEKLHDCEVRWCADIAFAWTPFVVEIGGQVTSRGLNIFTLLKVDGVWKISGIQDTTVQ